MQPSKRQWQQTKKVAEVIGFSNRKILNLLQSQGLIYKDGSGFKKVTPAGARKGIRWIEKQWHYNGADRNASPQQFYTVIELNPSAIAYVKEQLIAQQQNAA